MPYKLVKYSHFPQNFFPQVRAAAASVIAAVSKYLNKSIILNKIIPSIRNLITDPSEHVRVSLASSVNAISFLLDKSEVIDNLLPLLLLLLRDDAAEVRSRLLIYPRKYRFLSIENTCR